MTPLEMLVHHIFPLGFGGNTYPKSRSATTENSITKLKYRKSLNNKIEQEKHSGISKRELKVI